MSTQVGVGPGQNEIYIRGAAVDAINITVAESQGSAPNVALYLDEQPVTAGGRNLDVYISDMERIEVLPGPQGTLVRRKLDGRHRSSHHQQARYR